MKTLCRRRFFAGPDGLQCVVRASERAGWDGCRLKEGGRKKLESHDGNFD